jgi:small subunit ribosomal protein S20
MRNALKKFRQAENVEEVKELFPKVSSMLDKLAKRNVIHRNKASNLKSQMAKKVNSVNAA